MRITIVLGPFLPIPPVLGGAVEKVHFLLAREYKAAGHEVTILSRSYKNFPKEEVVEGIQHLRIPAFDRSPSLVINLAFDFCYGLRVARSLPKSDITITNSFFLPLLLPHRTAGKIYVHVARFPKHQMLLYSRADRLQAISRAVADEIARQAPSLAHKVVTIGYPVPDGYFQPSPAQPRKKIILFVGRIAREKGVHLLLQSFASMLNSGEPKNISEWKLRIVGPHDVRQGGDGEAYFNELLRVAKPLGSACELAGPVFDAQALMEEYRASSVFVYPSLAETGEAFGLAALEAMAANCAVVVSNLRCFDDFVEDQVNALKFDHRSPHPEQQLAAKLAQLIAEPRLVEGLTSRGKTTARKFQTSAIAGKMLGDFVRLVGSNSVTPAAQECARTQA